MTNYANFPWGTEFDDGVRIGPGFLSSATLNGAIYNPASGVPPSTITPPQQQMGVGLLLAPLYSYNITARSRAFAAVNAFATLPAGTVAGTYWFYVGGGLGAGLVGDNFISDSTVPLSATAFNSLNNGISATLPIQPNYQMKFDWPRALQITATNAPIPNANTIVVTVYGFDYWGFPMMERQTVTPTTIGGTVFLKAFSSIAFISMTSTATVPVGAAFTLLPSNTMGLPYYLSNAGANITSIGGVLGVNPQTSIALTAAAATAGVPVWNPATGQNLLNTVTISGPDVRGTVAVGAQTASFNLCVNYTVQGFDNYIKQQSLLGLPAGGAPNALIPTSAVSQVFNQYMQIGLPQALA